MSLETAFRKRFIRRLIETPEGRAYMLNMIVAGEESDQCGVFDRLAALADDESGRKVAARHKADEERHAVLYRACLARAGSEPKPVPKRLMLLRRMERNTEDAFAAGLYRGDAQGIQSRQDLMNTYAMMLVSEERAISQFPVLGAIFRAAGDTETADVFDQVTGDERRHVGYCRAMGRRYAPDEATWEQAVARFRRIEADAYREVGFAMIADALAHGLLRFGLPGRLFGRLLCAVERMKDDADQPRHKAFAPAA